MAGRVVVVDDQSDKIAYLPAGNWRTDYNTRTGWEFYGPPFGGSMHTTTTSGSFSSSFAGSSVRVYGPNFEDVVGLSWRCSVDNNPIGREGSTDALVLCFKDYLGDGLHTLTVNVTITATNETFYFDRIHYTPSPSASLENQLVLWQDKDPAIIYDNGWSSLSDVVAGTNVNGATVKISFIGLSLTWFTAITDVYRKALATATYTIDGGAQEQFSFGGNPDEVNRYNQEIMHTRTLPMGKHEMVVTYSGGSTSAPLSLDYLVIQNGSLPAPSVTSTMSGASSSTGTADASGSKAHNKGVPVGAIVGSVLGAIILALVGTLLYKKLRHRQQNHGHPNGHSPVMENFGPGGRFSQATDGAR